MLIGTIITPERRRMADFLGLDPNIPEGWPAPSVLDKLIECEQKCGREVLMRVINNLIYPHEDIRRRFKINGLEGVSGEI